MPWDELAPGEPGLLEWIGPALAHVDYFLPNDDQVRAFTGMDDLTALVAHGLGSDHGDFDLAAADALAAT